MSWFGSVRLLSIECLLAAAPLRQGGGGGRVASRLGVVSTRRRVLLCMLAFIYKFVKWGAARHKRHKQSRRTRGKTCFAVIVRRYTYCPIKSETGMRDVYCLQRTDSSVLRDGRRASLTPISFSSTLCSLIALFVASFPCCSLENCKTYPKYFNTALTYLIIIIIILSLKHWC